MLIGFRRPHTRAAASAIAAAILLASMAAPTLAHQQVDFQAYHLEIGFINEPVFVGDKSGLEFTVTKAGKPVESLEKTLKAQVVYQGQSRELTIDPIADDTFYRAFFIPTAAGPYTFHVFGTIEGATLDQSFTSSPVTFDEVKEARSGQFPNQLPTAAELQATAQKGADAASQVTIALALGAVGVLVGLLGVGLALAARRRP